MLPRTSVPGLEAPFNLPFFFSTPAAVNSSQEVFGVLNSKWNERSGRTVMRAGIGVPCSPQRLVRVMGRVKMGAGGCHTAVMCAVRALNSYPSSRFSINKWW